MVNGVFNEEVRRKVTKRNLVFIVNLLEAVLKRLGVHGFEAILLKVYLTIVLIEA